MLYFYPLVCISIMVLVFFFRVYDCTFPYNLQYFFFYIIYFTMPESSIDARLRDGLINDVVVATPVRYLHKKEEEVI